MNEEKMNRLEEYVLQVATPYSTGSGFYWPRQQLIATCEHIVRGNAEVVIDGQQIERQSVRVVYTDPMLDIAFLALPANLSSGQLDWTKPEFAENDQHPIRIIGRTLGGDCEWVDGQLVDPAYEEHNIRYLLHDVDTPTTHSGGLVLDQRYQILGMQSIPFSNTKQGGLALPLSYLKEAIGHYQSGEGAAGTRCYECGRHSFEGRLTANNCPYCQTPLHAAWFSPPFEPEGIGRTIEELIERIGHRSDLSRVGPNMWEIQKGSAKISISYHEKTGLIIGDAYLCHLPSSPDTPLLEYLLKQNHLIENLTFSLKGDDIVLSLLIYDRYLNSDTAMQLFTHLFERADHYDNILVEEYGAEWNE